MKILRFKVEGMTCASCVRDIEGQFKKKDGISVVVNFPTKSLLAEFDEMTIDEGNIKNVIETKIKKMGYKLNG